MWWRGSHRASRNNYIPGCRYIVGKKHAKRSATSDEVLPCLWCVPPEREGVLAGDEVGTVGVRARWKRERRAAEPRAGAWADPVRELRLELERASAAQVGGRKPPRRRSSMRRRRSRRR